MTHEGETVQELRRMRMPRLTPSKRAKRGRIKANPAMVEGTVVTRPGLPMRKRGRSRR